LNRYLLGLILVSIGLGVGGVLGFAFSMTDSVTVVKDTHYEVTEKSCPEVVPHTSLNPEEIKTILSLQAQPNNLYLNPNAPEMSQVIPTTSTTVPKAIIPPTTVLSQPPSTLPPSSTTLPPTTQTTMTETTTEN
jgi:hypothetical protein